MRVQAENTLCTMQTPVAPMGEQLVRMTGATP
jgi:hypothetical protein